MATDREAALEAVVARLQHELATPLLTAAGFARLARDELAGGEVSDEALDAVDRVLDGVERARATLAASATLLAGGSPLRVDLVQLLAARFPGARLPADRVTCIGDGDVVGTLLDHLAGLLRERDGGGDGPVVVEVESADGRASMLVTLAGTGVAWTDEELAAEDPRVAAATDAARSQLGQLWLDHDAERARLTLRLLRDPAPREERP